MLLAYNDTRSIMLLSSSIQSEDSGTLSANLLGESKQASIIRDVDWFPFSFPGSECFLLATKQDPLRLWDKDLYVRASYPLVDESAIVGPYSCTFDPNGSRFICGVDNGYCIFDIEREEKQEATKFSTKKDSMGIVSCVSVSDTLIVMGTLKGNILVFDSSMQIIKVLVEESAVLQIKLEDELIISNTRKSNAISLWCIRTWTKRIIEIINQTNQKLVFDVHDDKIYTGDSNGSLIVHDFKNDLRSEKAMGSIVAAVSCGDSVAISQGSRFEECKLNFLRYTDLI